MPSLDQATRRAPVEIEVPAATAGPGLVAWGFVRARIEGTAPVNAVRLSALARRPGSQDEVVKVVLGRAVIAHIAFATNDDGSLLVHRGLTPTDEILLSPNAELKTGDPIEATLGE